MSSVSAIPKLKLYPLYPGGPVVQNTGGLNANSSFTLPGTEFSPAYGVNVPPQSTPLQNTFYQVNRNGQLVERPISEARSFNRSLAVDPFASGYLNAAPVPAVAPKSPDLYQDILALYSVTDLKFSELMTPNNQFRIPQLGIGLQVTTNAAGEVDKIELRPSMQKAIPGFGSKDDPGYALLNTAEITHRATLRSQATVTPIVPGSGDTVQGTPRPDAAQNLQNPFAQLRLERTSNIFNLEPAQGPRELFNTQPLREQAATNPVLERLLQLQPQDNGAAVSGADAVIDAEQARQLAATNARFDVTTSERFKANLVSLVNGAKEAQGNNALQFAQARDGQIQLVPTLPNTSRSNVELGNTSAGADSFQAGANVADALDKKSSGGYMPFHAGSGGGNPFGGFDGSAAFGGYNQRPSTSGGQAGTGQQQDPQRRRPLAYTA